MEALWSLEEKLKLTNQEAGLLLVCAALAVIGLCTIMLKKKKKNRETKLVHEEQNMVDESNSSEEPTKKLLMDYMRWSERSAWEDLECGSWQHNAVPLLLGSIGSETDLGCWRSHNSLSPVWQRPILMGEKCELPRFSGLILYDEQGQPLIHSDPGKTDIVVGATLRDLF